MTQNVGPGGAQTYNPQVRASKLYQANSYHSLSQAQAMAETFRVLINGLMLARDACAAKTFDVMVKHNIKTLKIIDVLREELSAGRAEMTDPEGVAAADFLHQLYTKLIFGISDILQTSDPVAEFNALIERIKPVYKTWADADKKPQASQDKTSATHR